MPLYEYRCGECQASFEVLQRMGQGAADLVCPRCGGTDLAKQFSTFAAATSAVAAGRGTAPARGGCGAGSGFT